MGIFYNNMIQKGYWLWLCKFNVWNTFAMNLKIAMATLDEASSVGRCNVKWADIRKEFHYVILKEVIVRYNGTRVTQFRTHEQFLFVVELKLMYFSFHDNKKTYCQWIAVVSLCWCHKIIDKFMIFLLIFQTTHKSWNLVILIKLKHTICLVADIETFMTYKNKHKYAYVHNISSLRAVVRCWYRRPESVCARMCRAKTCHQKFKHLNIFFSSLGHRFV